MGQIFIKNIGVGGLVINLLGKRVLVDAFNTLVEPIEVVSGDIIVFTHDDGDHFLPEKLPCIKEKNIVIVGPPTILKPILINGKANIEQLEVLYTNSCDKRAEAKLDDISLTCFHTYHFNHWDPLHNSYLIETEGKRIYITGDSIFTKEQAKEIGSLDAVVCNLVDEGYLKGTLDQKFAIENITNYLTEIKSSCDVKKIIGAHLLGFEWSVHADALKEAIEALGQEDIIIPTSVQQEVLI